MAQCLLCLHTSTYQQPKGRGLCLLTAKLHALLDVRECKSWKLAAMDSVRSRTVRKIFFDDRNIAHLK